MIRLAPLFAILAACAAEESGSPAATFDGADAASVERIMRSALGDDVLAATGLAAFAQAVDGSCPVVSTAGPVTTLTGGCRDDRGNAWDGTLTLDGDTLDFADLSFHGATRPTPSIYDGTLAVTETSITGDLRIERDGLVSRSTVDLVVDGYAAFTVRGPSSVEVDGVGRADITGSWKLVVFLGDPAPTGSVALTGGDTALIDVSAGDARNCYPYAINGAAGGEVCYDQRF